MGFICYSMSMNKEQYIGSRSEAELAAIMTAQAGEMIAEPGKFDQFAGDLISRNICVLADRLSVRDYTDLSHDTKEEIKEITRFSSVYLPADPENMLSNPSDDLVTAHYRVQVQNPLHQLQMVLHRNDLDTSSELTTLIAQKVVSTAGTAFARALLETEHLPAVKETIPYFNDNAIAALNRLNAMREEPYFSDRNVNLG
jgi:hypothetical protein